MKHGRQRQRHLRREKTPSVICLPPPKPPLAAPRPEPEVARAIPLPKKAMPLPKSEEPLTLRRQPTKSAPQPLSRAVKRQTRRTQTKAMTSSSADIPSGIAHQAPGALPASPSDPQTPLPNNRALALVRPRILDQVGNWIRSFVMVKRPAATPAIARPSLAQIKALRREVAMMQKTLDQLLNSSRT